MKRRGRVAAILTLTVIFCFVLVSVEQAESAGPLKAKPTWQITQEGTATPVSWEPADNPRFAIYDPGTPLDLTDDAVLDKETGIVWERSPDGIQTDWVLATYHCYRSELANRYGSRLPTVEELASLVDINEGPPTLPAGHPFINVKSDASQSDLYWSSTTGAGGGSAAWVVSFGEKLVSPKQKDDDHYVWCVRGGQGHDAFFAPSP